MKPALLVRWSLVPPLSLPLQRYYTNMHYWLCISTYKMGGLILRVFLFATCDVCKDSLYLMQTWLQIE